MEVAKFMKALDDLQSIGVALNAGFDAIREQIAGEGLTMTVAFRDPAATSEVGGPAGGVGRGRARRPTQGKRPVKGYRMQDYLNKVVPRDGSNFTAADLAPKLWDVGYRGGSRGSARSSLSVLLSKLRTEGLLSRVGPKTYRLIRQDTQLGV